ncbi:hypothetical protein DFP72DRAFT_1075773 [Ephemerocybe angulata]|uniref:F-box domain-containing protein n=1 Tax=Ephemerocybe angulata TaxID=980116 RepID=A0A8H6M067_9AGAR|nr:hypothetical protein DFP72DRAFT_1075773 [Tulosesus angulatus]
MGKRKGPSQKKPAPRKKVKQDDSVLTAPTATQAPTIAPPIVTDNPTTIQPDGEDAASLSEGTAQDPVVVAPAATELTSTEQREGEESPRTDDTKEKNILEPDILKRISYDIILCGPPDSTPAEFGTPWHFAGFKHPVIDCAARATLRSVCKHWEGIIVDEINLWRDIHIDGKRIPSPPKSWRKGWGKDPENYLEPPYEDEVHLPVVDIVGEMPRAALSVERSQESPINLVLVDPTYDPDPGLAQNGRPFLPRPGMLELLHAALDNPMIGSLSISAEDVHFVKDLFDPGVYLNERSMWEHEMKALTDTEKISLAGDGKEADHFDLSTLPPSGSDAFNGIRTRKQRQIGAVDEIEHDRLRKKFKVWPELHTLRIRTRDRGWMGDQERCTLPVERAPALRHLELELYYEHPLWLWTFPYDQLTHLTLATEERDVVLLGVVSRCVSLESLTITFRNLFGAGDPLNAEQVVLSFLKKLCVQMHHSRSDDPRHGRRFIDAIDTPCLQSLEVISDVIDTAYPVIHLLRRSQCQLRELRLNFSSSRTSDRTPHSSPGASQSLDSEEFNLRELLNFASPTLEKLAIQSGIMDCSWLNEFSAPHLQKITVLCFGIEKMRFMHEFVEVDSAASDVALYILRWAEEWIKGAAEGEKSKRTIEFVAGPASLWGIDSTAAFYGRSGYEKCVRIPCPNTVSTMVSRIRAVGGNIDVWWMSVKRRSDKEAKVWREQKEKDEPQSNRKEMMGW